MFTSIFCKLDQQPILYPRLIVLISVSDKLPRLKIDNTVFTVNGELPDQYVIPVMKTFEALCNVKVRKATGPDNIPAWLLKESVDIASKWTEENYMKLNNEKSKEMIISFAKNGNFRHTIPNIKIDGIDVEQVDNAKLLGVTISHDLSWNKHVENIVKKAGNRLYMMYQLKRA